MHRGGRDVHPPEGADREACGSVGVVDAPLVHIPPILLFAAIEQLRSQSRFTPVPFFFHVVSSVSTYGTVFNPVKNYLRVFDIQYLNEA